MVAMPEEDYHKDDGCGKMGSFEKLVTHSPAGISRDSSICNYRLAYLMTLCDANVSQA
jgi:hypothetical protein